MTASIDNFWLFLAVKCGLLAACFLLLSLLALFLAVGFFLITMTGVFVVSWTVDFWDAAYVLFAVSDEKRRLDTRCREHEKRCPAFASAARRQPGGRLATELPSVPPVRVRPN
jgi:hypothetical protein